MLFGWTVAGDTFQCKLDAVLSNLDLQPGISDDVIILGEQADDRDHNHILQEFVQARRKQLSN